MASTGLVHKVTFFSDGNAISNDTTEIITYSALIPANTFLFGIGGIIDLTFRSNKTGGLGIYTLRVYTNTTDSLTGASLLASFSGNSASYRYMEIIRTFSLNRDDIKFYPSTITNRSEDNFSAAATEGSALFPFRSDNYILATLQLSERVTDVVYGSFLNVLCYVGN